MKYFAGWDEIEENSLYPDLFVDEISIRRQYPDDDKEDEVFRVVFVGEDEFKFKWEYKKLVLWGP